MKTRNTGVKREKTLGSKVNTSDWLTKEHEFFGPLSEWRDIIFFNQYEENTLKNCLIRQ